MGLIPDGKRYFRIGEASRIVGVEPYVLRYWESEFQQLKPCRADSNQRTYQKKDLEALLSIKKLLYDEKMTIEGARQCLQRQASAGISEHGSFNTGEIKEALYEILELLN
ncbi:MAG: MerR family transcriptional regulator [Desulfobulbaceae bacterium]|nr:MerR family transcriptional regulator [Desulfobulbaceae bacterium]